MKVVQSNIQMFLFSPFLKVNLCQMHSPLRCEWVIFHAWSTFPRGLPNFVEKTLAATFGSWWYIVLNSQQYRGSTCFLLTLRTTLLCCSVSHPIACGLTPLISIILLFNNNSRRCLFYGHFTKTKSQWIHKSPVIAESFFLMSVLKPQLPHDQVSPLCKIKSRSARRGFAGITGFQKPQWAKSAVKCFALLISDCVRTQSGFRMACG